jgi:hypothetical protein
LVNGIQDRWPGLSIVISLGNWRIIKGGIYVSKEKWKNYALLVHEWNVTLILLYYVFKLLIMFEITLCCNKNIIPTWCVRKSISRLTHFEKNYIFACYGWYGWYEFYMNRRVNHSISRPTPFVKTCNEKFKWNMDLYVRICRYDVYEYTYVVFFLWECYVVKLYMVMINESTSCVTCRSTLLSELVMITRLE